MVKDHSDREIGNPLPPHRLPLSINSIIPDRIAHTTAFVTPVVEHWLVREIAQWVHPMKDRSDDPSRHERTLHLAPWKKKNTFMRKIGKKNSQSNSCIPPPPPPPRERKLPAAVRCTATEAVLSTGSMVRDSLSPQTDAATMTRLDSVTNDMNCPFLSGPCCVLLVILSCENNGNRSCLEEVGVLSLSAVCLRESLCQTVPAEHIPWRKNL